MYKYDFGLSFAGEDREHAERLAEILKAEHIRVFYDKDEQAELWGQDLYQKFQQIYGRECRFFIPFISANYISKRWPKHEIKQAQARDFKSDVEYILPVRIDDTELPGLNETTGYIDMRNTTIKEVAQLCLVKLARDEPLRRLYTYLRDSNPASIELLENETRSMVIRVAISKVSALTALLSEINPNLCLGVDHHNTFMNGGFGPPGVVCCVDSEPHTTFHLTFSEDFFSRFQFQKGPARKG